MGGDEVLIYNSNLVVVFHHLIFGALLFHWSRSSAVHHVQEALVVLLTDVALQHRQWSPAAKVALMSAVAAKTGCGHFVIVNFSYPL